MRESGGLIEVSEELNGLRVELKESDEMLSTLLDCCGVVQDETTEGDDVRSRYGREGEGRESQRMQRQSTRSGGVPGNELRWGEEGDHDYDRGEGR